MEIDDLKTFAKKVMDLTAKDLEKNGSVDACFYLVRKNDDLEMVVLAADATNSHSAKKQLSDTIRARAAAGELQAVLFASDIFWANFSPEQDAIKRALRLNVEQACAIGLGQQQEGIMVALDTPIYRSLARQTYTRHQDEKRIEFGELFEYEVPEEAYAEGRMIDFFHRPKTSEANA